MRSMLIIEDDMHPKNIEMARVVKKNGGGIQCIQTTLFADSKLVERYIDFINAYTKIPQWLPFFIRIRLVWLRKWIGHIIKYRTLKAGKSSYLLRRGCSGMRDADYQTYLCEQQKQIFIKNGVPESKLRYNPYFIKQPKKKTKKTITILIPSENTGGVDRKTGKFIPYSEQLERWIYLVNKIHNKFKDWKIYLKFHPNTRNYNAISPLFKNIGKDIYCILDRNLAGICIEKAQIIIGLPPSFSTLLYQASVEYPWKKVISLDIGDEVFGDYFKGYKNIKVTNKI